MAGLSVSELMVAAGEVVAAAPAGTAPPTDLLTPPATPWVDLGYVDEDGVTLTDSPSETNIGAWQSADPVLVLTTEIARTFAFNLMQWNPDVLAFAIGGDLSGVAPDQVFAPGPRLPYAWLARWRDGNGDMSQVYAPRGRVTGDVAAQLVRTDNANFSATFTCTPEAGENAWEFTSEAPAFAGGALILRSDGQLVRKERNGKQQRVTEGAA